MRTHRVGAAAALGVLALPVCLLAAEAGEAAAGAEHGAHGEMNPVIPPTAWGIIIFLTVLLILWKKAFPPITAALEKRAKAIEDSLAAAERAKAEAEALMKRHEESLEKARAEARAIIEEGKADAVRVKESIVESARREAEEISARAKREIELAKRSAIDDLHRQAVKLSFELAAKVVKKALKPEDHQELITQSLGKFKETKRLL